MQIDKIHEELGLIAEQVKRVIQLSMEKKNLVDSHIYEDLDVSNADLELIKVLIHDYYQYIESGMEIGNWVDAEYLLPWMADKGIPTDNDTLWHIQNSIYLHGIKPRPFFDEAWEMIDDYWSNWADDIFNILMEDIDDWFNN